MQILFLVSTVVPRLEKIHDFLHTYKLPMYCNIWQDLRLLGELHVALQIPIIKDTEDITKTSSVVLGVGQSEYVDPGGSSQICGKVCVCACVRV